MKMFELKSLNLLRPKVGNSITKNATSAHLVAVSWGRVHIKKMMKLLSARLSNMPPSAVAGIAKKRGKLCDHLFWI